METQPRRTGEGPGEADGRGGSQEEMEVERLR